MQCIILQACSAQRVHERDVCSVHCVPFMLHEGVIFFPTQIKQADTEEKSSALEKFPKIHYLSLNIIYLFTYFGIPWCHISCLG